MDRSKRDKLIQDYVDIRVFMSLVQDMKSRATCNLGDDASGCDAQSNGKESGCDESDENVEEVVGQSVGQVPDLVREHQSVQVPTVHSV